MYKAARKWVTTHPFAKIGAFLLAFSMWFYINTGVVTDAEFDVLIQLDNLADKVVHIGEHPVVTVKVRGSKETVMAMNPAKIKIRCSIVGPQKGGVAVDIFKENISVPRGVEVTDFSPKKIILNLQPER